MAWRLRRVAAGLRQVDVAARVGISATRMSAIERGEEDPSDGEIALLERILPPLDLEPNASAIAESR